jgi:UDP-GlcNAc:undecaprenyl-phosphate GlcNAc-1-phosphate transferase
LNELNQLIWPLAAFALAMGVSFATTPLVKILAHRVGAIDVPTDERRMHTSPIPRLGGLAIFFGFITAALLFCPMTSQVKGILLGGVFIIVLGVFDDIMALSAKVKLVGQIVAALFPVAAGLRVEILTNFNLFSPDPYIHFGIFSIPVTILWIVGITNAVNLIDGLDGLAVGISSIASCCLFLIAVLVAEGDVAIIVAALAGGCIGFMPYNFNPAKIFMGDTGAMFLGYILGTVSVLGLFKFYAVVSFAVPFLILGLPIFDTAYTIVRRMAQGRSPMSPDRGHLHHKLIDMGFSQKQTVAILYSMSAILGLSAVVLTGSGALKALLLILTVIIASMIAYQVFSAENKSDELKKTKEDENELLK